MLALNEQKSARRAIDRLGLDWAKRKLKPRIAGFPLVFLHGRPGAGKSALVQLAFQQVMTLDPAAVVRTIPALDLAHMLTHEEESPLAIDELRQTDLLAIEDIQFLPGRAADAVAHLIDHALAYRHYLIITGNVGPMLLDNLPAKLQSRLAGGLVVGLEPLTAKSRRQLLHVQLQAKRISVEVPLLDWLAEQPGEARDVLGQVARLETLQRILPVPLRLTDVSAQFLQSPSSLKSSCRAGAEKVSKITGIKVSAMKAKGRTAGVAWARQLAMYLIRESSNLSLPQIGQYFGKRDHTTVLHACQKLAALRQTDPTLDQQIRRWLAELAGETTR